MESSVQSFLLILFLPLWVSVIIIANNASDFSHSKKTTFFLSVISNLISIALCLKNLKIFQTNFFQPTNFVDFSFKFLSFSKFNFDFGILIDNFSLIFCFCFLLFMFFVQFFLYFQFRNTDSIHKIFINLNLLSFASLGSILSNNLIQSFLFLMFIISTGLLFTNFCIKKNSAKRSSNYLCASAIFLFLFLCAILASVYITYNFTDNYELLNLSYSDLQTSALNTNIVLGQIGYGIFCFCLVSNALFNFGVFPFFFNAESFKNNNLILMVTFLVSSIFINLLYLIRVYPFLQLYEKIFEIISIFSCLSFAILLIQSIVSTNTSKKIILFVQANFCFLMFAFSILQTDYQLLFIFVSIVFSLLLFLFSFEKLEFQNCDKNVSSIFLSVLFFVSALSLSNFAFNGFFSTKQLFYELILNRQYAYFVLICVFSFLCAFSLVSIYSKIKKNNFKIQEAIATRNMQTSIMIFLGAFCIVFFNFVSLRFQVHLCNFKLNILNKLPMLFALCGFLAGLKFKLDLKKNRMASLLENNFYLNKIFIVFYSIIEISGKFLYFIDTKIIHNFINSILYLIGYLNTIVELKQKKAEEKGDI